MFRKFVRIAAVVVLGSAMTACKSKTGLDDSFGMDNGGMGEGPALVDTPLIGDEGGLGMAPPLAESSFTPLPDELQIWPNVYFAKNQYVIGAAAVQKLDKLAEYMIANPNYSVVIEGHCSITGSAEYNRSLSEKRALVSQEYLINKGVSPSKVDTVAFGKERPAVPGNTEAAHAKNRRDVFIIGTKK